MLHPLRQAHPQHAEVGGPVKGADLLPEHEKIVRQHEPNRADNQHEVDPSHPAVDLLADASAALGGNVHMHFALGEVLRCARMALAARNHQVGLVDARTRVGRGEDPVHAVATRAVGRQRGTVLRRQPVVALKEGFHPVRGQIVFRVEPLRSMTLAAELSRNPQRRTALQGFDLVLRMAIGAGGRFPAPRRHGFAVHALFHVLGHLLVTPAARLGQSGEIQGRSGGRRRQDGVAIVTIAAIRGAFHAFGQGQSMHAGAVALGLLLVARSAVGRFRRDVIIGVIGGNVGVAARARVGLVNGGGQLGHINKEGDFFAGGVGLGKRLIPVALQAGAVLDRLGGGRSRQQPAKSKKVAASRIAACR